MTTMNVLFNFGELLKLRFIFLKYFVVIHVDSSLINCSLEVVFNHLSHKYHES